jgi:hypothetical protein
MFNRNVVKTSRVAILIMCLLTLNGCATGSSIVTGQKRAPIDFNLVKLYLETPENYEAIGIVKASSDAGWTEQDSVDYAIEELKKQAAKLGANGVLLMATGEQTTMIMVDNGYGGFYSIPSTDQTVSGKAIICRKVNF